MLLKSALIALAISMSFVGSFATHQIVQHPISIITIPNTRIVTKESSPIPFPKRVITIKSNKPVVIATKPVIHTTPDISTITYPACLHSLGQQYGQDWNGDIEQGEDFNCSFHTLTYALWSGTLVAAERTCWNDTCTSSSGGVIVINSIVHNLGRESTYYLHLDMVAQNLRVGQTVQKGQFIGYTGGQTFGGHWPVSPGFSSGPHIEIGFDAWFLCSPNYHVRCVGIHTNPLNYIEEAIA